MNTTPSHISQREFIALMAFLMSIAAMSIDAMIPALSQIGLDLGATSPNQPQLIIAAIFVGMSMGQLVSGPLSDAIGRKRILFGTIALYLIGSVVCFFAPNMEIMLAGRILQGLGVSGPYVAAISVVRDKYHGRQMARIMSLVMMIFIMVPAIAPSVGQAILFMASWHYIFVMYMAYALAVMVWVTLRMEETLPPAKRVPFSLRNIRHGISQVFRTRSSVCYMVSMGLVFGGLMGYLTSSQQIFQDLYGVGDYFALCFGGLALMFGASSLVNSRYVEKLGMRPICRRAFLANILISAAFVALNFVLVPTLWMFLLYAALTFFNFGLLFGNLNALAMEPMGHIAGLASAVIGAFSSVLSILMGTTIGQLYNGTVLPIAAGFLILGIAAYVAFLLAQKTIE